MTDANAWIGEEPSVVTRGEAEDKKVTKTFFRTSEKPEINSKESGLWELVLNGIRSKALHTYDHPAREVKSVVDFIVVNEKALTYLVIFLT